MVAKENDVIQLFKDVSLISAFEDDYVTSAFENDALMGTVAFMVKGKETVSEMCLKSE